METEQRRLVRHVSRIGILSIVVLVLPAGLQAVGAAGTTDTAEATPAQRHEALQLAAGGDYAGLLTMLVDRYDRTINDYTGVMVKQERLGGKLSPEQRIAFKFRQEPFSVYMEWLENPVGARKVLYVAGRHEGKMLAHPTGLMSWVRSVKIDPEGSQAARSSLYPITRFGFHSNMIQAIGVYEQAAQQGQVETRFSGPETIAGREYFIVERFVDDDIHENAKLTIHVDLEYLLPTRISAVNAKGELISRYEYHDLQFNTGLSDKDFDPKTHRME